MAQTLEEKLLEAGLESPKVGATWYAVNLEWTQEQKQQANDIAYEHNDPVGFLEVAARRARQENAIAQSALAGFLSDTTPQEAAQWVEDNVNTMADVKPFLKFLVRLVVAIFHMVESE